MKKEIRKLKVSTITRKDPDGRLIIVPSIRMTGKWLTEAGFNPSDTISLKVNNGKIEIHAPNLNRENS